MPVETDREVVIGDTRYLVVIGLCTHLGCIPDYREGKQDFKCACHGGEFNAAGVNTFGPPPKPLVIPPFQIKGTSIVLGEEGPEYKKMQTA
jgi:ubiquinol-cytochrome c reductase iron-sulfur subunit